MIPMSDQRALGPPWAASVALPGHFKVIIQTVAVCIMFISARIIEMIEAKMQSCAFARIEEVDGFAWKFSCNNYLKMGQALADPSKTASAELPANGGM